MAARKNLNSVEPGDVPSGGEVVVLTAHDGVELRVARWPAPSGSSVRGTVLLCHGFTEFIEKYYEVIADLRGRGFAVLTLDWRGQGLSTRMLTSRRPGYASSFADFVQDALLVLDRVFEPDMPRPLAMLAHSMGGNIGLRLLQEHGERFDRAVLCAPMVGWDQFSTPMIRAVSSAFVALGRGASYAWGQGDANLDGPLFAVSSDRQRTERWLEFCRRDSDLVVGGPTWRWMREASRSTALVMNPQRIAQMTTPTLLASAGRDEVVSSKCQRRLAELAPMIELVDFPTAMHEILQESDEIRDSFWAHFGRFMAIRV